MSKLTINGSDLIAKALKSAEQQISDVTAAVCRAETDRIMREQRRQMAEQSLLYRLSARHDRY